MAMLNVPENEETESGGRGWEALLVAVLVVLALFGYLYFFTDLIRSHSQKEAQPQPAEQPVRKHLPQKSAALGALSSAANRKQPATPVPESGSRPPSVAPAPAPAPVKPVAAPAPAPVTPAPAAPAPVKSAAEMTRKPSQPVTPPAPPVKPVVKQPVAEPEPVAATPKAAYSIQCGPFISYKEQLPARKVLKKAGLKPTVIIGPKQPTLMYRLFVKKIESAGSAAEELKKLLEVTPDAFMIPHDGVYDLFAGSYHDNWRALKIQSGLAAKGVTVELQQVTAPAVTRMIVTGTFPNREAADAVAEKLKKEGVPYTVVQRGR